MIEWFPWKDEYSVGIPQVDKEHKRLIALINKLQDAMAGAQGKNVLGSVLDELVSYTFVHFNAEEALMQHYDFPGLVDHQLEHARLKTAALKLSEDFRSGSVTMTVQVMQFLKNWLQGHIMRRDQEYAKFIAASKMTAQVPERIHA
jgi:hemerythrin-like metal-binding protein